MTLEATFSLTPRSSYFASGSNHAIIYIYGVTIYPNYSSNYIHSFDNQHTNDQVYFHHAMAVDPNIDYTLWNNRRYAPRIRLYFNLPDYAAQKELALVFGFDARTESRLLIFSNAGLLGDETLTSGDNQFLMEVQSLETDVDLYFIHAKRDGSAYGGHLFFKGIIGYVV